jgi:hypothetical protein
MTPDLALALQLAGAGLTLVFGAILALWGGMALLTRLTSRRPASAGRAEAETERLRRVAAAAALAVVRARQVHAFPLPPTALVSAWQAVMRASQLRQRGPVR